MESINESKAVRAYKKVDQIKKFYWYLGAIIFATFLLLGVSLFFKSIEAPDFLTFMFLVIPVLFWIVALTEYIRVFDKNPFFGKKWEERKIKKFMNQDWLKSEKYRSI